jgi:hypothetical protein
MAESVKLCLGHFARVATNLDGFALDVGVFETIRHGSADGIGAFLHPGQRH